MTYVTLIVSCLIVGLCVGVSVYLYCRYRGQLSGQQLKKRMSAVVEDMNELLLTAEKKDDFTLRCRNDLLMPCWELRQCGRTDCEAYEADDFRCWHAGRPVCRRADDFRAIFERTQDCQLCVVYQQARPDFEHSFIEQFNDVMAMLENKTRLLREAQNRADEANRLASIGEFAAGLAHELNNPLDGILSCTARLEREPENLAQNIEYLRMIREALNRLAGATHQLLEYSRQQELQREMLDIHTAIEHAVAFVGVTARQQAIEIKFDLDNAIPLVQGDRHALTQVFLNLLLNAAAAIGKKNEGKTSADERKMGSIMFRTRLVKNEFDGQPRIEVAVIDNGAGIEQKHLDRVFEPFYTTKDPGKGTGMGLTVVRRIVAEHGGIITIESEPGQGAVARVILPIKLPASTAEPETDYNI